MGERYRIELVPDDDGVDVDDLRDFANWWVDGPGPSTDSDCRRVAGALAAALSKQRAKKQFTLVIEADNLDGGFVASSDDAPGCMSQGTTIVEAIENFADALLGWALTRAIADRTIKACRIPGAHTCDNPIRCSACLAERTAKASSRAAANRKGAATRSLQANARRNAEGR